MYLSPAPIRDSVSDFVARNRDPIGFLKSGRGGTNGLGLVNDYTPPCRESVAPGGLLDANGMHFPIVDIDAPKSISEVERLIKETASILFFTYEYRFSFGVPEQLELEEFKKRLIKLRYQEKGFSRPTDAIKLARSFKEIMSVEFGTKCVERFYGTKRIPKKSDLCNAAFGCTQLVHGV